MASKPYGWDFLLNPMAKELGYGVETLRKYINELIDGGWLKKGEQNNDGKFGAVVYTLLSAKNTDSEKTRHEEIPTRKNTDTEIFRHGKNPTQYNKDNEENKESIDIKDLPKKEGIDKLVVLGDDGLYYKLNANAETVSAEQTDYNSLDGSIITAKSINAEKISVSDLVAFAATIGNFHILSNAIYSGSKSSIDNSTQGIYMLHTIYDRYDVPFIFIDKEASSLFVYNYLKYYKDADGNYKLDISADSLSFSGLNDIQDKIGRINVGTDSQNKPYIELSADDSEFKLRITNDKIEFIEGSSSPAWISDQKLYIEQAEIKEEFKFGNFAWVLHGSDTNKNMGLVWKEGN